MRRYILDAAGNPQPAPDLLAWAKWMEAHSRYIARDRVSDEVMVSTVFLGLDHSLGQGAPVLFETMVFGGKHDHLQRRYTSRQEAVIGHAAILGIVTRDLCDVTH